MDWNIPKMWEGGECWIIGGGPSIPREFGVPEEEIARVQNGATSISHYSPYLSPIHNKHVIAVNAAYLLGTWVDVVFFGDVRFYTDNRKQLAAFPRPKVSPREGGGVLERDGVKKVRLDVRKPMGISSAPNSISWNKSSGSAAINLAYHFGVKRVYLLGFDMDMGQYGNQHWHRHYMPAGQVKDLKKVPFRHHLPAFPFIDQDAARLGLEIINVSQESKITEFKKMTIKEIFG